MKRSAVVLAVIAVLLVPLVVQAVRLQVDQGSQDVAEVHVEIHTRGSDDLIICDGVLELVQGRASSVVFDRTADNATRCLDVVEAVGILNEEFSPSEVVLVHADAR